VRFAGKALPEDQGWNPCGIGAEMSALLLSPTLVRRTSHFRTHNRVPPKSPAVSPRRVLSSREGMAGHRY
jgi:hypothetical protein